MNRDNEEGNRVRDNLSRPARCRRAATDACLLALALALAACSAGGTATPAPSVAPTSSASGSATAGLPTPPPVATLPPTPPTGTAATRPGTPGTPGIFGPATPPTASRATTPDGIPSATRRQTAGATPLTPVGERPAGWLLYQSKFGFTIAYPPEWTAEENAARGLLYLYGPDPARTTFLVIASGAPEANPNLDVLRDRWFQARTAGAAKCARFAVDTTGQERHSDLDFATVGITCDLPGGLAYSLTGIGLLGNVPWIYELDAPYADFAATRAATFAPILATWQIAR